MSARKLLTMTRLAAALPHALAWHFPVGSVMQARAINARCMSMNIVCNEAPVQLSYFAGIRSRGEPTQLIAKYSGVAVDVEVCDRRSKRSQSLRVAAALLTSRAFVPRNC